MQSVKAKAEASTTTATKSGHIYLLKNPSYRANYHKLGKTADTVEKRARKLSQPTGVPTAFVVVYQHHVSDCHKAEALAKERLKKYRVADTEFFDVQQNEAIRILMEVVELINKPEDDSDSHPYADAFMQKVCAIFETGEATHMSEDEFKVRIFGLTSWAYWRESFSLKEFAERTGIPEQRVSEILRQTGLSTEDEIAEERRRRDAELCREVELEWQKQSRE